LLEGRDPFAAHMPGKTKVFDHPPLRQTKPEADLLQLWRQLLRFLTRTACHRASPLNDHTARRDWANFPLPLDSYGSTVPHRFIWIYKEVIVILTGALMVARS